MQTHVHKIKEKIQVMRDSFRKLSLLCQPVIVSEETFMADVEASDCKSFIT